MVVDTMSIEDRKQYRLGKVQEINTLLAEAHHLIAKLRQGHASEALKTEMNAFKEAHFQHELKLDDLECAIADGE